MELVESNLTLKSAYRSYLSDMHAQLRKEGSCSEDEAMIVVGALTAMKIAFEVDKQPLVARYISEQTHSLIADWTLLEITIHNVFNHLEEQVF